MSRTIRTLGLLAIAAGVAFATTPAMGQPFNQPFKKGGERPGPDGPRPETRPEGNKGPGPESRPDANRGLESELSKITRMLGDIDARLKKLEAADKAGPQRGPDTRNASRPPEGSPRGFGFPQKQAPTRTTSNRGGAQQFGRGSMWQGGVPHEQFGRGPDSRDHGPGANSDVNRKLDQLIHEIEDLKRSLNRR